MGKALLAFDPEAARQVLAGPLLPRTRYTITDPDLLREELDRIRTTGIACDREENALGVACAAAPILVDDRAVGAVSVTCSPTRFDVERYASAVKAAAHGIRRSLTPGGPRP
jgi:DNA-binding IclR family transcriptional regulator